MGKKLHELAPQMIDYDRPGIAKLLWVPYVMYYCGFPGAESHSCSFDNLGYRRTVGVGDSIFSFESLVNGELLNKEVDLFVGGSTANGVGSTSDASTIPGMLSRASGKLVLNMGMRSWLLAQNMIHFMFLRNRIPKGQKIDKIILFAGYNELNCMFMSCYNSRPFGNMYGWSKFFSGMNTEFLNAASNEMLFPEKIDAVVKNIGDLKEAIDYLKQDLDAVLSNWKLIGESLGASVHFILQPVLEWIDKRLSLQEEELLAERSAAMPHEEAIFAKEKEAYWGWYAAFLKEKCDLHGLDFLDMNKQFRSMKLHGRWLYVDPWHLTDEGNGIASNCIAEPFY